MGFTLYGGIVHHKFQGPGESTLTELLEFWGNSPLRTCENCGAENQLMKNFYGQFGKVLRSSRRADTGDIRGKNFLTCNIRLDSISQPYLRMQRSSCTKPEQQTHEQFNSQMS